MNRRSGTRYGIPSVLWVGMLCLPIWAAAQIIFPYYGKNRVRYDHFQWKVYPTEHFDIYFYPETRHMLPVIAGLAENGYRQIYRYFQSAPPFRIPLIYFRTQAEFEQVNYVYINPSTLGVAEPVYNRVAFAIDHPPAVLRHVIVHEIAHIFEFGFLFGRLGPAMIFRPTPPLWVMEGFAEFVVGERDPSTVMIVRDAVLTERLPYVSPNRPLQLPPGYQVSGAQYTIGYYIWDFIQDRFGDAGVRQLWYQIRKQSFLGGFDAFLAAFGVTEERFNDLFSEYMRHKFETYRDREPSTSYERIFELPFPYRLVLGYDISPDGRYFALITVNLYDFDLDVIVVNREGKVLRDLIPSVNTKFQYLEFDREGLDLGGHSIAWSQDGRKIAFFARKKKFRSLFVIDVWEKEFREYYIPLDKASAPQFHPDGVHVSFTAFRENGQRDIFWIDLRTRQIEPLTDDPAFEESPVWTPDGRTLVYVVRTHTGSGLYRFDLRTRTVEDLTPRMPVRVDLEPLYGPRARTLPYYLNPAISPDGRYIVFSADIDGAIDLYRYDMETGEIARLTRTMTGNLSPKVWEEHGQTWVYFLNFFKGNYHLYRVPLHRVVEVITPSTPTLYAEAPSAETPETPAIASEEAAAPPRLNIDPGLIQSKGFRPVLGSRPVFVAGADQFTTAFAGAITIEDILGDQRFTIFLQRISSFNTYYLSYLDLSRRLWYLTELIWADDFFIAPVNGFFSAIVKNRQIGANVYSLYPLDPWKRFEIGLGVFRVQQKFLNPTFQLIHEEFIRQTGIKDYLLDGWILAASIAYIFETTKFQFFGPVAGNTGQLLVILSPRVTSNFITRYTVYGDYRHYFRLSRFSLLAVRLQGFYSEGDVPNLFYFGGGLNFRGYDFRQLVGNRGGVVNIEYRFPLLPSGLRSRHPWLNMFRGYLFFDGGLFRLSNLDIVFLSLPEDFNPADGIGSIGIGITVLFGGLPFNVEFSFRHNFRRIDRKLQLDFSIGYPF